MSFTNIVPALGVKTVLLFGCQCLLFDKNDFNRLRDQVTDSPDYEWMAEVISELPVYYRTASTYIPELKKTRGKQNLQALCGWFRTGMVPADDFPLKFIQLAPLLIVTHVLQYLQYMKLVQTAHAADGNLGQESARSVDNVGFCIGLLSACVVSNSKCPLTFKENASAALRLAMLIGAIGDARELEDPYTSLATVWKRPGMEDTLANCLEKFPQSYVTVRYDENRVTIMAPRRHVKCLQRTLQDAGFSATQVNYSGRYHWAGNEDILGPLMRMCAADPDLQLRGRVEMDKDGLWNHELVIRSILLEQCNWSQIFGAMYKKHLADSDAMVVEFGLERCVPPRFLRCLSGRVIHFSDLDVGLTSRISPICQSPRTYENDIAVVGMACRVAGADDLEGFWKLLCSGESQHRELPLERYENFEAPWRPNAIRPWFGNFVRDIDAFDHRFFKKVPREAISQDPQQRLILQVAYQALEQAGYFQPSDNDLNIGCYIASCAVDYEHNVNCLLRSFLAGKLSHYFGWRGPAFCACQSILRGECTAALVGGANAIISPLAYDMLAGASFVSPTGPCKPFDADADGYCRGEGFAAVFIKRMADALSAGDTIFGIIAATGVEQNANCTPIVVPDTQSLAHLFTKVTQCAHLHPRDISVVEAHGTGTQAGDPVEYASIRQTLGGPQRKAPLFLGSVKGLVGHTEGVSGLVALVKVLLMLHERKIPPQPNFRSLNPHISASADDNIILATRLTPWDESYRAALINNYGASGSNASMVVTQAPGVLLCRKQSPIHTSGSDLPFRICALDECRLRAYAERLRDFIRAKSISAAASASLANLSFSICRQSNPTLETHLAFKCGTVEGLDSNLTTIIDDESMKFIRVNKQKRPVVLCFGGQISNFVGLDRCIYDAVPLLRHHLDICDSILQEMGQDGLYPGIFETVPILDPLNLQTKLFALQYACAQSWIESGLSVAAVVGHSFGELTATCVSGALGLSDALNLICRRAKIVRDSWGNDSGAMIAVDATREEMENLLEEFNGEHTDENLVANIACFNGPRSFTLAGSTASIDKIQHAISASPKLSHLKTKRLSVTNAFHSRLVDPLLQELERVTDGLTFNKPTIYLEHATENISNSIIPDTFVAEHLRRPVYFHHAVGRLAEKYKGSVWLEAGSNSTITLMAARALESPMDHHFQPVNITGSGGLQALTDTTIRLWKENVSVQFWGHHACQAPEYAPVMLPPYQFQMSRHWLESKKLPSSTICPTSPEVRQNEMVCFMGYGGEHHETVKFQVNTSHPRYQDAVLGHVVAHTAPVAPASIILDTVFEALFSIPEGNGFIPRVYNLRCDAPLCPDPTRELWIELKTQDAERRIWDMKYFTRSLSKDHKSYLVHCRAQIVLHQMDDQNLSREWAYYSRMVSHRRCKGLLNNIEVDDALQGRTIYPSFAEIVDYSNQYRGVQKLVGKGVESAGRVIKKYNPETWADAFLCDCFAQIAGFWVNCMTDRESTDIYLATGLEQWMRTPKYAATNVSRPDTWDIFAMHERHEGYYISDIFVFDPRTGDLVEVFMGIQYARVAKTTFATMLNRFSSGPATSTAEKADGIAESSSPISSVQGKHPSFSKRIRHNKATSDLTTRVRAIVANFCAIDPCEIHDDGTMADVGIDSLMAMELAKEMEEKLSCTLSPTDLMEANTFSDLVKIAGEALGEDAEYEAASSDRSQKTSNVSLSDKGMATPMSNSVTSVASTLQDLQFSHGTLLEAFGETKRLTDRFLTDNQCSGDIHTFAPVQVQLCIALTLEAFEELGCSIGTAAPGQRLAPIQFDTQHQELVDYLYKRLEEAHLIELEGSTAVRTAIAVPLRSSVTILEEISRIYPEYLGTSRLAFFTGSRLASVLRAEQDGLQLIFGTQEGQELVSWMYGDEPHNVTGYKQIIHFIERLVLKLQMSDGASGQLRILEMGAGTGGGTKWFLPRLAKLGVPVEYTFTDISPAFLAQAKRRFREYPFMKYRIHDIEKEPADDLIGTQHIIIASNAVHATANLQRSTGNMRRALRPDGVLVMLEMTRPLFAVDIVFGLFRGWWVFNDGRNHAITNELRWEADLHAVGYGHVDWTDGSSVEASVERVIFATASGPQYEKLPIGPPVVIKPDLGVNNCARELLAQTYVQRIVKGFRAPTVLARTKVEGICVLVTGATGSLGSHIVAHLARLPAVKSLRQHDAFEIRGIKLAPEELDKISIHESNMADSRLGLKLSEYEILVSTVTHIVHNAWPMNGASSLGSFEPQFDVMGNLVHLARDIASTRCENTKVCFQFVSSIGVVGRQPLLTAQPEVPEERSSIGAALPNGYSEAKYVCERILDETLHKYPDRFTTMVVRPGQIAGSSNSGYWNPKEHFPAVIKSSQTLKRFPAFHGILSWTPVNDVAATLAELLLSDKDTYPIYHIDNPVRQDWSDMVRVLAGELNIPFSCIIPFSKWARYVKAFDGTKEDNPAIILVDWLEENFERMSCGGLLLRTCHAQEHSPTLAHVGPIGYQVVHKYLQSWRDMGFLHI
ncbi:hypothetical protein BDV59DRAFT_208015 [Aspergillus ambiguus]|uniref:uncharacterized protein n=1 Tax=Aspergillus ambiguus TaxID=176160 RepID=UPI003CCE3B19